MAILHTVYLRAPPREVQDTFRNIWASLFSDGGRVGGRRPREDPRLLTKGVSSGDLRGGRRLPLVHPFPSIRWPSALRAAAAQRARSVSAQLQRSDAQRRAARVRSVRGPARATHAARAAACVGPPARAMGAAHRPGWLHR
eukprot:scaffold7673_cov336-Prasinococcus_capsulatus_cf.AAC.2